MADIRTTMGETIKLLEDPDFDEILRIISYLGETTVSEFYEFWDSLSLGEKQEYKSEISAIPMKVYVTVDREEM